jgi:hypothetical protein
MRGAEEAGGSLFGHVDLEARIPARHPLRKIRPRPSAKVYRRPARMPGSGRSGPVSAGPRSRGRRLIRAGPVRIPVRSAPGACLRQGAAADGADAAQPGVPPGRGRRDRRPVRGWGDPETGPAGRCRRRPGGAPGQRPAVSTGNRDRPPATGMSRAAMAALPAHPEVAPPLSDAHAPGAGTRVRARAAMQGFQPKPEAAPPDDDPGSRPGPDSPPRANPNRPAPRPARCPAPAAGTATPRSISGAKGARTAAVGSVRSGRQCHPCPGHRPGRAALQDVAGTGAMPCFMGHAPRENRSGPIVQGDPTRADGHAERRAAPDMIHRRSPGPARRRPTGASPRPGSPPACARPA